jgi:tyrosine-protein kinase Fer
MGLLSHGKDDDDAFLIRQDSEIRLLEIMRKCLLQKAKADKEYAIAVLNVVQVGSKIERADDLAGGHGN